MEQKEQDHRMEVGHDSRWASSVRVSGSIQCPPAASASEHWGSHRRYGKHALWMLSWSTPSSVRKVPRPHGPILQTRVQFANESNLFRANQPASGRTGFNPGHWAPGLLLSTKVCVCEEGVGARPLRT